MIAYEKAVELAHQYIEHLNQSSSYPLALIDRQTQKVDGGWKFSYNSQAYVDGKEESLMGYLCFAISEESGELCKTGDGSELGQYLEKESKTPFF